MKETILNLIDTPWKIRTELWRIINYPIIRAYFIISGVAWHKHWRILGCPLIQRNRKSSIKIGNNFSMRNWITSNPLSTRPHCVLSTRKAGARIVIGNNVGITSSVIVSESSIIIGDRVRIGANTTIIDTDFHPLSVNLRNSNPQNGNTKPVIIEDDSFIGMNCIILKGTHIEQGVVVGAGSVVSGHIKANSIIAGNPAIFIKHCK